METKAPSPQTTLLILLGASEWPLSPEFQNSEAFANAAKEVKAYFLDPKRFGLPTENLLDLFNSNHNADEIDVEIGQFLEQHIAATKVTNNTTRDLVLYFVGHGGFVGRDSDFYLAIRRTRMDNPRASGIQMISLADTLIEKARYIRRIIILDCCFAAAAFSAFQAGPAQVALEKTIDAFEVRQRRIGFPAKGTTLLCASSHKSPSLILPDSSFTMFTKAFLDALAEGMPPQQEHLSLRDVKDAIADHLYKMRNAPRPVVLSPDQSEGDVADIPFFPNIRAEEERVRRTEEEERIRRVEKENQRKAEEVKRKVVVDTSSNLPTIQRTSASIGKMLIKYDSLSKGGNSCPVKAILWSPDSTRLAIMPDTYPGIIHVLDANTGKKLFTYVSVNDMFAMAWSPDSTQLASSLRDYAHSNPVSVWDASTGQPLFKYAGLSACVYAVAWSPNGTQLAFGLGDKTVQVWDVSTILRLKTYTGHSNYVNSVAWSLDGVRLASGSEDKTVRVWDANTDKCLLTYVEHSASIYTVAWSPDGTRLASGSKDKTMRVWDASTGQPLFTCTGHFADVTAVAWSSDGTRLASGSRDNTVRVWDASMGQPLFTYTGHSNYVNAVAWSPDSTRLASGSRDNTVQVWQAT